MFKNQTKHIYGFTLVELLVTIAIVGLLSSVFIITIRNSSRTALKMTTEQLIADMKYIRNLATSRVKYDFDGQMQYPPGGYGICFNCGVVVPSDQYIVYADNGQTAGYQKPEDEIIRTISFEDNFEFNDKNDESVWFYFAFLTESDVESNMILSDDSKYELEIIDGDISYQAAVILGEESHDGYVWSNMSVAYAPHKEWSPTGLGSNGNTNGGAILDSIH